MKIFPAIDLMDGRAVRLTQGDYGRVEVFGDDPVAMAEEFYERGSRWLHVVDLDGAKKGKPSNFEIIKDITSSTDMFVEVGGGIRSMKSIDKYLSVGASRVIIGTAAIKDPEFLRIAVTWYGDAVAAGVDARNGKVAVNGWLTVTDIDSVEFCNRLLDMGIGTVIYTDIERDGLLSGANLDVYGVLSRIEGLDIIASGGISSLEEIRRLRDLGISGAIVGKAIYTGLLELEKILEVAEC
ncbi:MAG TPA: 1-(5-phosphoribosyl)-5-[(5-phosphoribosylamino)methylideneamino]imidazole-4-carboxamide isomerase [Clostridiales bacterium]|nr:1-(5-phosphoribosyl)-5-[(5-phosphoribosylamino)methylideneamino]imidazole-4-carboxamide isomerase [Clostridiales bacterium]